jgi:hypothetical protein
MLDNGRIRNATGDVKLFEARLAPGRSPRTAGEVILLTALVPVSALL